MRALGLHTKSSNNARVSLNLYRYVVSFLSHVRVPTYAGVGGRRIHRLHARCLRKGLSEPYIAIHRGGDWTAAREI